MKALQMPRVKYAPSLGDVLSAINLAYLTIIAAIKLIAIRLVGKSIIALFLLITSRK